MMRLLRGRRVALAAVVAALGVGLFAPAVRAQPPVDPDGSATRWSFDYVQAAVESLVNEPLPAAYGGVTISATTSTTWGCACGGRSP